VTEPSEKTELIVAEGCRVGEGAVADKHYGVVGQERGKRRGAAPGAEQINDRELSRGVQLRLHIGDVG
jgi:hypothetical protein